MRAGGPDSEQRVLEALDALLRAGESFTTLDVRRITAHAGIARTSFYNHFPDKTAVLLHLLRPATDAIFSVASGWARDPGHDLAGLEATTLAVLHEYREHAHLLRALGEATTYEPRAAAFWRAQMEDLVDVFRRRIAEGRGPASTDARTAAMWLAWGTERAIAQHVALDAGEVDDAAFAAGIARQVWATMSGDPRSS